MNTGLLLQCFLTLHVMALTILAGTTVIDYISFRTFWKFLEREREKSLGLLQVIGKFSRLLGIGSAVLILTGIGMMAITHGVFGEQLWFRIKFALVLILIANGLLVGRRQGVKLKKLVQDNGVDIAAQTSRIKVRLRRFHLTQLCLLATIIFLSVFKFN